MCGTREYFVAFRENHWNKKEGLNKAIGIILCACITFLSWLKITT